MTQPEPVHIPGRAGRLLIGVILTVGALVGGYALLRGGGTEQQRSFDGSAASFAPPSVTQTERSGREPEAIAAVFEPDSEGKLTIPARALASGRPIQVTLLLAPEEIGDQPMTVSIRSRGETHELGEATLDRATGRARLSIDPERLTPGKHLLAIRVAGDSWNPNRRIAITVTED